MVSSNMALRWVAYPTQVIGKSAKPIPVMVLGVLIGRKSYTIQRYFFVFLIVTGVVLCMLKDKASVSGKEEHVGIGEILLLLSLSMDGLTGAIQDRMRAASAPSAQHMMLSMNAWATGLLAVALVATGEIFDFIYFAGRFPHVWLLVAGLALSGAVGQLFIFTMVRFPADFMSAAAVGKSLMISLLYSNLGVGIRTVSLFGGHHHTEILLGFVFSVNRKPIEWATVGGSRHCFYWPLRRYPIR